MGCPYTYAWSVTKQGANTPFASGTNSNFNFTPNDNGTYNLSLTVTDSANQQATAQQAVTVTNSLPTATMGGTTSVGVGTPIQLTSQVTDPGTLDTHTYSWVVMRGATQVATGANSTLAFTPVLGGTYTVTLTASDNDSGSDSDVATIVVVQQLPRRRSLAARCGSRERVVTTPFPSNRLVTRFKCLPRLMPRSTVFFRAEM